MKRITLDKLEDYLVKSGAYDDPKILKIYDRVIFNDRTRVTAITFLRTWFLECHFVSSDDAEVKAVMEKLTMHGHVRGIMEEIAPIGRGV